jgi:hypothetical protein
MMDTYPDDYYKKKKIKKLFKDFITNNDECSMRYHKSRYSFNKWMKQKKETGSV